MLAGKEFDKIPGPSKNKKLTFSDNDDNKSNDKAVVLRNIGNKNNDHYYVQSLYLVIISFKD
jgi:hypothetical protein